jgi:putative nucleotidyltransferase with HDIG domain
MTAARAELKEFVKGMRSIPALPGVLVKLDRLTGNDRASVGEIARVVSSDQALAAKVLRLVNSPFYGFPSRVSTISNAMVLVGINVIRGLILSSSVVELMEREVVGLWEHSMGTAVAANVIAKKAGIPDADEIATAALLHDVGRVLIKLRLGGEYCKLTDAVMVGPESMLTTEREQLQTDHAEIGGWLAHSWLLPDKLIEPITCHHDVERSSLYRTRTAVVHVADVLIKASGFGFSGDEYVSRIHPLAWKAIGLSDRLLSEVLEEMDRLLMEARDFSSEIQSNR